MKYLIIVFLLQTTTTTTTTGALLDSLALWYPFNSTINDCSGNSNNPAFVSSFGGPFYDTDRCGNQNGALRFKDSSYLEVNATSEISSMRNSGNWTISCWVNFNSTAAPILDSGYYSWLFRVNRTIFSFHYTPTRKYFTGFFSAQNIWNHFAVTSITNISGSALKLFINGDQRYASFLTKVSMSSSTYLYIGYGLSDEIQYLTGKLSDFMIFNRALSNEDIMQLKTNNCTFSKHSSEKQRESSFSNGLEYSSTSKSSDKITQVYVVLIIEFDTAITDTIQLETEIATILGIDQSLIEVISISSTEIQVTIYGQSLSDIQQNTNTLIDKINDKTINNGLLRNAIDAYLRGDNSHQHQTSFSTAKHVFSFVFVFVLLSFI